MSTTTTGDLPAPKKPRAARGTAPKKAARPAMSWSEPRDDVPAPLPEGSPFDFPVGQYRDVTNGNAAGLSRSAKTWATKQSNGATFTVKQDGASVRIWRTA